MKCAFDITMLLIIYYTNWIWWRSISLYFFCASCSYNTLVSSLGVQYIFSSVKKESSSGFSNEEYCDNESNTSPLLMNYFWVIFLLWLCVKFYRIITTTMWQLYAWIGCYIQICLSKLMLFKLINTEKCADSTSVFWIWISVPDNW